MNTVSQNVSLKKLNTFGIAATARYFQPLQSVEQAQQSLSQPELQGLPLLILGSGSNILFTQDFPGLVIKNELRGIETLDEDKNSITLKIAAGENWHELVLYCVAKNFGGIENLSLIPGTVGAAPIQNIGAYGSELKDVFVSLFALRIKDQKLVEFTKEQCQFGYRDSIFKSSHKNQYLITHVVLRLTKKISFNLTYQGLQDELQHIATDKLTIKNISDAVIKIRQHKLPDPNVIGNAGSFFKNPIITQPHFSDLQTRYPKMPHYQAENAIKIPAAWLIEQCGYKGHRRGDIGIHHNQALVLVNFGKGLGQHLAELANEIQQSVYDKFKIQLETEVNII